MRSTHFDEAEANEPAGPPKVEKISAQATGKSTKNSAKNASKRPQK